MTSFSSHWWIYCQKSEFVAPPLKIMAPRPKIFFRPYPPYKIQNSSDLAYFFMKILFFHYFFLFFSKKIKKFLISGQKGPKMAPNGQKNSFLAPPPRHPTLALYSPVPSHLVGEVPDFNCQKSGFSSITPIFHGYEVIFQSINLLDDAS